MPRKNKPNKDYSKDLIMLRSFCFTCGEEMRFDEQSVPLKSGFVNKCKNGHINVLKYPYPYLKRGRGAKR